MDKRQDRPQSPNTISLPVLLALTGLWTGLCLLAIRRDWAVGALSHASIIWQLAAGSVLFAWGGLLAKNLIPAARWPRDGWLLLALALLLRLILLPLAPIQSDDIYRYIWEGRIQWLGWNPYAYAPDAPALAHLRDTIWPLINHQSMPAIYPPLAQWSFMLAAKAGEWAGQPVVIMKLFFTLCDMGVLILLLAWLKQRGRHLGWAALWAFHPLVILEFSGNGHLDSLMVLTLALALMTAERTEMASQHSEGRLGGGWAALALVALTAAGLTKLVPFILAPFFFWTLGRRWFWLGAVGAISFLAYLPYLGAGPETVTAGARLYGWNWCGNDPAFELLRWLRGGDGFAARRLYWWGLGLLIGALWLGRVSPSRAAVPVLGFYLVVGPMVHPWYLTPFVALTAAGLGPVAPWLWLTVTVPLAYWRPLEPVPAWAQAIMWLPFWAMLAWHGWHLVWARSNHAPIAAKRPSALSS